MLGTRGPMPLGSFGLAEARNSGFSFELSSKVEAPERGPDLENSLASSKTIQKASFGAPPRCPRDPKLKVFGCPEGLFGSCIGGWISSWSHIHADTTARRWTHQMWLQLGMQLSSLFVIPLGTFFGIPVRHTCSAYLFEASPESPLPE